MTTSSFYDKSTLGEFKSLSIGYLPRLLQFSGPRVQLRNEAGAVADGDRERISGMSAKTSDESGRSDADFQIRHNLSSNIRVFSKNRDFDEETLKLAAIKKFEMTWYKLLTENRNQRH